MYSAMLGRGLLNTGQRRASRLPRLALLVVGLMLMIAAPSYAASPVFALHTNIPNTVTAGNPVRFLAVVQNVGDAPFAGDLTFTDTFPVGIAPADPDVGTCQTTLQTVTCTISADGVLPGGQVYVAIVTSVDPGATGTLENEISVSGAGTAAGVNAQESITVGPPGPFRFDTFGPAIDASSPLQAGSNPEDITTELGFPTLASTLLGFFTVSAPVEQFKDVTVHLPAGLVGNPQVTPVKCTAAQLALPSPSAPHGEIPQCPQNSQLGIVRIAKSDIAPVYNMVPPVGVPAEFGFQYQGVPVVLDARLRPTDYGVDIVVRNASSSVPVPAADVTVWGVPSDASHDDLRGICLDGLRGNNGSVCPSDAPRKAFLRLPTSCSANAQVPWSADANSYQHPDSLVHADATTEALTGCDALPFAPSLAVSPTTTDPRAPSGLDATIALPQFSAPEGVAEGDLRRVTVTLPDGMAINPSSASGLRACTDNELRIHRDGAATCPAASKIGTVRLTTPLLDHTIEGSVYVRTQNSSDPASGEMFRIAIEVRSDDDGVDIKLPGSIRLDPTTGQVSTTFDDNPQLPFTSLALHLKSGPRAPLVTPGTCGNHTASGQMLSWTGATASSNSDFSLNPVASKTASCPTDQFAPRFNAGSENAATAQDSRFLLALSRTDDDQEIHHLSVNMPTGLLARIANVVLCSNAAADAGTCQEGSRVGTVSVGAGAGPSPFYINDGQAFLTGAYRGGKYGLSIVVPAVAGPFDLGTVVVRAAIFIDPQTTGLRIESDPLPAIVRGVPGNVRDVRVTIDRQHFIVNPTSCAQKQVAGTITSTLGAVAHVATRFQLGSCSSLDLTPKISLSVGAPRHTRSGVSTPLTTTLRQPAGQANLRSVSVTLPGTLNALLPVVNRACSLKSYHAGHCGTEARVGSAVVVTPLLRDPLRGSVYFVKNPARVIPDLMVALRGAVDVDLTGKVFIPGGKRLATRFDAVPDAPFTKFILRLVSGTNGPVGAAVNLCSASAKRAAASISFRGQNGKLLTISQRLHVNGCRRAGRPRP